MMMLKLLLSLFLILSSASAGSKTMPCIRRIQDSVTKYEVCVAVDDLTASKLAPKAHGMNITLRRLERQNACKAFPLDGNAKGHTVVVLSNRCSLATMVQNVRQAGYAGLMVVANMSVYPVSLDTGGDRQIPVILIAGHLYLRLTRNATAFPSYELLPALETGRGDAPILIFLLLTLFVLSVGMWFSVHGKVDVPPKFLVGGPHVRLPGEEPLTGQVEESKCTDCATFGSIVFMMAFAAGSLLLLYFFYDTFVWVVLVLVCFLFTFSFKSMLMEGIVRVFSSSNERCTVNIKRPWLVNLIGDSIDKRGLAILPLCVLPPILWFVYRKTIFGVILQDICGVVACIQIIKTVRFGSLKTLAILGAVFFIYDVFMVYITPFFMPKVTSNPPLSTFAHPLYPEDTVRHRIRRAAERGTSIMEAVATGSAGTSDEKLPLVFNLPSFNFDGSASWVLSRSTFGPCYFPASSVLGFGDLILPGLLLAYCFWCDTRLQTAARRLPWLYSVSGLIGYEVGLGLVYVLLIVMQSGQPALIMLIPCTVLPFIALSLVRKEFLLVWNGVPPPSQISTELNGVGDTTACMAPSEGDQQ